MPEARNLEHKSNNDKNFNALGPAAEQTVRGQCECCFVPVEEQRELHSMVQPAADPASFRTTGSNSASGDLPRSQGRLFQERRPGLSNSGNHPGNSGTVEEEPARQTVAEMACVAEA